MWDDQSSLEAFAATGWRVGWLIGPKWIMQPTLAATTRIVFCTNSPLQEAAACGLEQAKERKFFETQREEYLERRGILAGTFDKMGLKYTLPEGGYFILLVRECINMGLLVHQHRSQDVSRLNFPEDYPFPPSVLGRGRDFKCVLSMITL